MSLALATPPALSGFLLRSDTVAGWPDPHVTATVGGSSVEPLHTEQLSQNTMMCLFQGEITAIAIALPVHILHFTLGDAATQWRQAQRVVDITALATTQIGGQRASQAVSGQLAARLLAPQPQVDIPAAS